MKRLRSKRAGAAVGSDLPAELTVSAAARGLFWRGVACNSRGFAEAGQNDLFARKINGTTNGHEPSIDASSTAGDSKRIRTVRSNNREDSSQARKTLAPAGESGVR